MYHLLLCAAMALCCARPKKAREVGGSASDPAAVQHVSLQRYNDAVSDSCCCCCCCNLQGKAKP